MIGQKIDRYVVLERLGQGGMGVVYKARDTLLDRLVALKVLPPDKSSDAERRQRFLGEAKAASALNHPGIVSVHDVVTVDSQDVIVMELVEGETLEQRLARKRPSLTEALGLGIQIADALGRAHGAGIVHRDLKPANVMLTPEGGVKILDFGLAKLTQAPFVDDEAQTLSRQEGLTAERAVVGTVAWMSPEQASGKPVDPRSDVFTFGLLLYEMLTGQHPFRRGTTTQTLSAIAEDEPEPPARVNPAVPVEAERAVLRCLRKDPSRRWQSVSDLGAVLADIKEDSESGRGLPARPPRRRRIPWGLVASAVVLLAVAAATLLLRRGPAPTGPPELQRLTYDAGLSFSATLSPDGHLVAYASDRAGDGALDIWVRHINQPEPVRVTDHPADDWMPRFSPDGSRIVFQSSRDGGGIYVVGALGGEERRIAPRGRFASFSPDGTHVVYIEDLDWVPNRLRRILRVPAEGGAPEELVPGYGVRPSLGPLGPVWSPDGRYVLFPGAPFDDPRPIDWWVAPVDGGEPHSSGAMDTLRRIDIMQFPAVWIPGQLLFLAGTPTDGINVYRARISDDGRVSGPAELLTSGSENTWTLSVSVDGRMALSRFQWFTHLWEVELDPETGRALGPPRRLTRDVAPKFSASLTHDGTLLAFPALARSQGRRRMEIHVRDRDGHESVPISKPVTTIDVQPRLSGDGARLAWAEVVDGERRIRVAPTEEPVGRDLCEGGVPVAFLGGTELLVDRGSELSRVRLSDGHETPVLELDERWFLSVDLSRDERWVAARTGEPDGRIALRVLPLDDPPPPESWVEIAGVSEWVGPPAWSHDGRFLYYLSDRDDFICLWARRLDPATKKPQGDPFPVVHAHGSAMSLKLPQRSISTWALAVGGPRLVFNAAEMTGNIYTTMLPPPD